MTELKRVMDAPSYAYENMLQTNIDLAKELGNELRNVNQIAIDYARSGYSPEEIESLTATSVMAQNISELETSESSATLIAAMKSFNIEAENSVEILDRLNEVDKLLSPIPAMV